MQVVSALGHLYGNGRFEGARGIAFLSRWPACLVASMTGVAVTSYAQGTYWPALWKVAGYAGDSDDQRVWGTAFAVALAELGPACVLRLEPALCGADPHARGYSGLLPR